MGGLMRAGWEMPLEYWTYLELVDWPPTISHRVWHAGCMAHGMWVTILPILFSSSHKTLQAGGAPHSLSGSATDSQHDVHA